MGRVYGYARVSSNEQHLDRQIEVLTKYGVEDRFIITDKISGKDFSRPGYQVLKNQLLRSGDTLVIKELDRLGRNYEQIKNEWNDLRQMGIDIVVLDMPIASIFQYNRHRRTSFDAVTIKIYCVKNPL
jgi:DNA invertase Pin-like site-specific DNA recombinase